MGLRDVLLALACLLAPLGFVLAALMARVEGSSMQPTLQQGDVLLVNKLQLGQGQFRRGDIVVLRLGNAGAAKRVIGLPGDEMEIDHGRVLLKPGGGGQWRRLAEPYLQGRVDGQRLLLRRLGPGHPDRLRPARRDPGWQVLRPG